MEKYEKKVLAEVQQPLRPHEILFKAMIAEKTRILDGIEDHSNNNQNEEDDEWYE